MKLAFSTLGCPEWSIEQIIDMAVAHGYSGVELRGTPGEHVDPSMAPRDRCGISTRFEDAGIEPFAITAYTDFISPQPAEIARNQDELKRYIELAADLGACYVRSFIGKIPPETSWNHKVEPVAQALCGIADSATQHGVTVLLETHDDWSSTTSVLSVIERINAPSIKILWDVPHSLRVGDSPATAAKKIGNRLGYVHLKDEAPAMGVLSGVPVIPGTGIIPVPEILTALASISYDDYICFEWERKWHPDLPSLDQVLPSFRAWVGL